MRPPEGLPPREQRLRERLQERRRRGPLPAHGRPRTPDIPGGGADRRGAGGGDAEDPRRPPEHLHDNQAHGRARGQEAREGLPVRHRQAQHDNRRVEGARPRLDGEQERSAGFPDGRLEGRDQAAAGRQGARLRLHTGRRRRQRADSGRVPGRLDALRTPGDLPCDLEHQEPVQVDRGRGQGQRVPAPVPAQVGGVVSAPEVPAVRRLVQVFGDLPAFPAGHRSGYGHEDRRGAADVSVRCDF